MLGRLAIAGAVLALFLRAGGANADPQPEPMLVPPVSPACISSPFGPRVLASRFCQRSCQQVIAGSMKDEIFQATCNILRTVAVRRRKWNLR
jgi:hypothetical protein